jgi:lysophospholipase L1-like esterase
MSIKHTTTVDIGDLRTLSKPIHLMQYDKSLPEIEVHITKDGQEYTIPSGYSATIRWGKPDKHGCTATGTVSGSTVTFQVTEQMACVAGRSKVTVEIVGSDSSQAGTAKFEVIVDSNPIGDNTIVSDSEIADIQKAIEAGQNADKALETATVKANEASTSATTASQKAEEASASATKAKESETNASNSAKQAQTSANSIANVTSDVDKLKEDLDEYLLDSEETIIPGKTEYNMLNPENSIVGTLNMQGVVFENPSSMYLVSDFIEIRKSETYAFSYYHTTYNVRYALYPGRTVLYDNNKTFVGQTTSIDSENDYFTANRIAVSGNTCYLAVTPKADGYIRMQYGANLERPQIAIAPYYEYLENFSPIPDYVVVTKSVKKKIITREQLADDAKNELIKIPVYPNLLHVKLHNSVCCIGDSLTEGYHFPDDIREDKSYPKFIGQLCAWETENKGMSGITALGWWNTFKDTVDFTKYDAFIIYLGTNGGLTDTIEADTASGDYNTFAQTNTGGYCAICAKIRTVNPKAKIYVVKYGNTTVSNITQSIADKYNCTVLVVTDSTYYDLTNKKYHNDATHYNTLGYFCFAHSMAIQIEKYISEHLSEYIDLP